MFKRILIPTGGSKLAAKGVKAGVKLAKASATYVPGLSTQESKQARLTWRVLAHSEVPVLITR